MKSQVLAGPVAERIRTTKAEGKTPGGETSPVADGLQDLPTNDDSDPHANHSHGSTSDLSAAHLVKFSGNTLQPSGLPEPAAANLRSMIFEPRRSRNPSSDALVPPVTDLPKS